MKEQDILVWAGKTAVAYRGYPIILTRRQQEVLLLLCEGLSNKVIGRRLGVADATVKTHVASVLRSLNVSSRLEAVTQAFKLGLVRARDERISEDDAASGRAVGLADVAVPSAAELVTHGSARPTSEMVTSAGSAHASRRRDIVSY